MHSIMGCGWAVVGQLNTLAFWDFAFALGDDALGDDACGDDALALEDNALTFGYAALAGAIQVFELFD